MNQRKHWKQKARASLRHHYGVWILLCLLMTLLSGEKLIANPAGIGEGSYKATRNTAASFSGYSDRMMTLLEEISEGRVGESRETAKQAMQKEVENSDQNAIFGRSRGVLSQIVNRITSGSFLISLTVAVGSLIGSDSAAAALMILLGLLIILAFNVFVVHPFRVAVFRMFLEGMNYPVVHMNRIFFLLRTGRWFRVSLTMLLRAICQLLWNLTIIGGIIKHYSYYLVPVIAAENPSIHPMDAMRLSRRMMDGRKWECFCLELSFLGWEFLNLATFGLLQSLFLRPYRMATACEFYRTVREDCRREHLQGSSYLNDEYLFRKPESFLLESAYSEVIRPQSGDDLPEMMHGSLPRFLAVNFGLFLRNDRTAEAVSGQQSRELLLKYETEALNGTIYPIRLSPIPEAPQKFRNRFLNPLRCYSIGSLILIFFAMSILGWVWEVSFALVTEGVFVNRGMLHGPWLPIYGAGSVLVLLLLYRFRSSPVQEFLIAIVLSGVVEFGTSYITSQVYHQMWWDYHGYFLNLDGRICAEGLLVFGIGGLAIVYLIAPVLDDLIRCLPSKVVLLLTIGLLAGFAADDLYSAKYPNEGAGITSVSAGMSSETLKNPN